MYEYKRFEIADVNTKGRTLVGYAAAFNNVDRVGDIIERGAFTKTINEGSNRIKVFLNHQEPIGKPTVMNEDDKGLYTESKISKTNRGDEVLELIQDGVISEMSIAYEVVKGDYQRDKKARILKELKLFEYGPVYFPANPDAVISGVKSFAEVLSHTKDVDDIYIVRMRDELKALLDTIETFMQPPDGTAEPPKGTLDEVYQLAEYYATNLENMRL